jgi:holo-[acyl-carrier protein] synthase
MNLAIGVDLVEIERIAAVLGRHGPRFLERIYTPAERALLGQRSPETLAASLAARWAAKEATAKALGTGIGPVSWQEIEIYHDAAQRPSLHLSGAALAAATALGLDAWTVSLSHTRGQAVAMVVGYSASG